MQMPLAHLDASAVEEVPVDLWKSVFEAVGWPASLAPKKSGFTHEDVLLAFERDEPSDELLLAIETLHALGTESGREAIMNAINDRRVSPQTLPTGAGEREFALRLFLAQRTSAELADVFARAQAQVQESGDHRRYSEFMGADARWAGNLKATRDRLEALTIRYCNSQDLGEHVNVRAFEDDGVYVFHIIRTHHTKKPLAVVPGRTARATIEYRPVHGDILRYDAQVGRLRVAARASSVVQFYRRALGAALFNDESFFTGEPVCSLRVLQERGRAALADHSVPGIGRVWMTECLWERGDRDLLQIRSNDCFRNIEELGLPLAEGVVIQAKLKVEVVGRSTRPVTVNIRVPSTIEITQKSHEGVIDQLLMDVGIRNAKAAAPRVDLWSVHPWRHPVGVWRTVFGAETDYLVRAGILRRIQLTSVQSPDHLGAGNVLVAHEIKRGDFYGVSRAPEIPSRSLSLTDLDGLELAPEALRGHLRAVLGLDGPSMAWDGHELLDLGILTIDAHRLHLQYAIRPPPPGTGDRLRARGDGAHVVVFAPTSVPHPTDVATAQLGGALLVRRQLVRRAIAASGLGSAVPANLVAPDGVRLVVDTGRGRVWIDDIAVEGLRAGTHPFQLVETLARSCPSPVPIAELATQLSANRGDGDTTARQAKTKAREHIAEAMKAAGRGIIDDPFPPGPRGCYRCALPAHVA